MRFSVFIFLVFAFSCAWAQKVEKVWETSQVLKVPESVLFSENALYVSNVNGNPTDKNELGFISKLGTDGKVEVLEWAKGLNAPKGMGIYKGKLYVSDIDEVVAIDLNTGEKVESIVIKGSEFLNDISISQDGVIAVSDMNKKIVHFIKGGKVVRSVSSDDFNYVNGLYWNGDVLLAGTSGTIYKITADSDTPQKCIENTGGVDGLEKVSDNTFVVTDWSGRMQLVSKDKEPVVLLNTTDKGINAADIGYNAGEKIIYVPTFKHNTVAAYKLVE